MNKIIIILCALLAVKCLPQQYTSKYDNMDLQDILKSDRLLGNYVKCLLDKGKCGPDGQELRSHIEDALLTDCEKCTEKQREGVKTVIAFLVKNKRDWWNELEAKYDPSGVYRSKYAEELKATETQLKI